MKEILIKSAKKEDIIDITKEVKIAASNVKSGIITVFTQHTTCAIIINENYDPNLRQDIFNFLGKIVPKTGWLHDRIDNNAAAHLKSIILGSSISVPIKDGKLLLGRWQSIALVELDGPRERKIIVA